MKGIYLITNTVNGKQYVGMSNDINRRFQEHRTPKNIKNKKTVLAKAFRKYTLEKFVFEILEIVEDINDLSAREVAWIKEIKPLYNMNQGGLGNKGHRLSDDMKQALRTIAKAQWASKTDIEKQYIIKNNLSFPAWNKGKKATHEEKERLRLLNLGKKQSHSTKMKRSKKMKVSMLGNKNGNKKIIRSDGKIFDSAVLAANEVGVHPSGITGVLKGKRKTSGGYKWNYLN